MTRRIVNIYEYEQHVSKVNKDFVRDFIVDCKSRGLRPNTINQYSGDLRIILFYIYKLYNNKNLTQLSRKEIKSFSIMLQDRGLSPARVNRVLSSLRCCLEYLADDEEVKGYDHSLGAKVKGPKIRPVRELTYLRDDQVQWLKNRLLDEDKLLEAVYFMLSYISGQRKSEVYQVKKEGLLTKLNSNKVEGKGGKEFWVGYNEETQELIRQYLELRGPDDIPELFVRVYKNGRKSVVNKHTFNAWTTYMSKLLSEYEGETVYFRPHDLRRSRFTNLKEEGVPIEMISSLAHHNDISTTARYIKSREEEDVIDIITGNWRSKKAPESQDQPAAVAPKPVIAPVPLMIDRTDKNPKTMKKEKKKSVEQLALF